MKIKMLNTSIIMNYRYDFSDDICHDNYDTEFIVKTDEPTTFSQIDCLLTSFCELKDTHSLGEFYLDKRMIALDKDKATGIFTVKLNLHDAICYDEFMCETNDFKTFDWYARNIKIEEKAEDFKPIK